MVAKICFSPTCHPRELAILVWKGSQLIIKRVRAAVYRCPQSRRSFGCPPGAAEGGPAIGVDEFLLGRTLPADGEGARYHVWERR